MSSQFKRKWTIHQTNQQSRNQNQREKARRKTNLVIIVIVTREIDMVQWHSVIHLIVRIVINAILWRKRWSLRARGVVITIYLITGKIVKMWAWI